MSNYVYEDIVPFKIRDVGYYIPTIKQGVPTNINTLAEGKGGFDPDPDFPDLDLPTPIPMGGILFTVDKSIWNSAKNIISGADFNINILITSNNSIYIPNSNFSSITCVFGEEYENIEYVTLLGILNDDGARYFPTVNTSIKITYLPTNTTFKRENIPVKTAGGRVIGRHVNWEGSVINFDQYGTRTNLFVPDAKYRNNNDYELIPESNQNNFDSTSSIGGPVIGRNNTMFSWDYPDDLISPDTDIQSKLDTILLNTNTEWAAKQYTNAILQYVPDSPACLFARSIVPSKLSACDIPNIYELCVLWIEGKNIDTIDPTINEYQNVKMDNFGGSGTSSIVWSSTESRDLGLFYGPNIGVYDNICKVFSRSGRKNGYKVIPILEL